MVNWKMYGGRRSWFIEAAIPANANRNWEDHEQLIKNNRLPGRESKSEPPKYDAGMLTTHPQYPMSLCTVKLYSFRNFSLVLLILHSRPFAELRLRGYGIE
jgi:hypothetical protein